MVGRIDSKPSSESIMPRASVFVNPRYDESYRERFSLGDQSRVEFQSSSRSHESSSRVTHGIIVHPFNRIIDPNRDRDVNGKSVRAIYEVRLEILHAKPCRLR